MTVVEIEYSVRHGYRRRADDVQAMIDEELAGAVERVELVEGDDMDFIVRVDGDRVWDKKKHGYDPDRVLAQLKEAIPTPGDGEEDADDEEA